MLLFCPRKKVCQHRQTAACDIETNERGFLGLDAEPMYQYKWTFLSASQMYLCPKRSCRQECCINEAGGRGKGENEGCNCKIKLARTGTCSICASRALICFRSYHARLCASRLRYSVPSLAYILIRCYFLPYCFRVHTFKTAENCLSSPFYILWLGTC